MKVRGKKIIYKALFLDEDSSNYLRKLTLNSNDHLPIEVNNLHVTFEFKPEELFYEEYMDKIFEIDIIGYGNNGRVEGYQVEIPKILIPFYTNNSIPHITVNRSEDGKPVETGGLDFFEINSFKLYGYLGYFNGKEIVYHNE